LLDWFQRFGGTYASFPFRSSTLKKWRRDPRK